jgi:fructokinase
VLIIIVMDNFTLIGIGEVLWDEFPGSKRLGGAPANFAFHAAQLGGNGLIISRIGDDPPGRQIKDTLDEKKIPYILSSDPLHPTGKVSVTTDEDGTPEYIIHTDASWDYLSLTDPMRKAALKADAICFGSLAQRNPVSGDAIQEFIGATKKDCLKIFDINLRQEFYSRKTLAQMLGLAGILKLNHDELDIIAEMFLKTKEETTSLEELKSMFNLDIIVLTKGKDGSRIFADKNNDLTHKPAPVEVIDSVGAGDSFTAAVALGLLKGFDLEKIIKAASTVASHVCSKKGATPVIPPEILQLMK